MNSNLQVWRVLTWIITIEIQASDTHSSTTHEVNKLIKSCNTLSKRNKKSTARMLSKLVFCLCFPMRYRDYHKLYSCICMFALIAISMFINSCFWLLLLFSNDVKWLSQVLLLYMYVYALIAMSKLINSCF